MASSVALPQTGAGFIKTESTSRDRSSAAQRVAGALLMLPGIGLVMGWLTAEALYPQAYSTHANSLSHLGATEPPNSIALQPSATIFDATMIVAGLMLLGAAYFTFRAFQARRVSIPIALLGIGAVGVGIFALNVNPTIHTLVALLAFSSGGVTLILASTIAPPFFRYLWMALGVVALVAITLGLFFAQWAPIAALGLGGIERWNAYLIVLWLVAFGGMLMSGYPIRADSSKSVSPGGRLSGEVAR
jgi:hypothetical membrane protein